MATTTNLSDFGYRELDIAADLLRALADGNLPDDFYDDGVQLMMNTDSGNVFLTNSDYQVAMLNDDNELESWYYLSYGGNEGFASDLYEQFKDGYIDEEDYEELYNILDTNGLDDEAEDVMAAMEELGLAYK